VVAPPANVEGGPANDNFADSEMILFLHIGGTGSNAGATIELGEPLPCGLIGSTVWYNFLNILPIPMEAETRGSSYDTVLAAYTGDSLSGLTLLSCNDDSQFGGTFTLQSKVLFTAGPLTQVNLQLGGFFGQQGTFNLEVYPAPLGVLLE
jgi:hypothetical protein